MQVPNQSILGALRPPERHGPILQLPCPPQGHYCIACIHHGRHSILSSDVDTCTKASRRGPIWTEVRNYHGGGDSYLDFFIRRRGIGLRSSTTPRMELGKESLGHLLPPFMVNILFLIAYLFKSIFGFLLKSNTFVFRNHFFFEMTISCWLTGAIVFPFSFKLC